MPDRQQQADDALRAQDRHLLDEDRYAEPGEPLDATHCGGCGMPLEADGTCKDCEMVDAMEADDDDHEDGA